MTEIPAEYRETKDEQIRKARIAIKQLCAVVTKAELTAALKERRSECDELRVKLDVLRWRDVKVEPVPISEELQILHAHSDEPSLYTFHENSEYRELVLWWRPLPMDMPAGFVRAED